MKNKNIARLLSAFIILAACSPGQKGAESQEAVESQEWTGMDEFHMILAESFHPYMDSGNLEPVKLNAIELAHLAEKWVQAPLPGNVDREEIRQKLSLLETESETLASLVNSGDDRQIEESLTNLHDLFHELQDAWYTSE